VKGKRKGFLRKKEGKGFTRAIIDRYLRGSRSGSVTSRVKKEEWKGSGREHQ